MVSTRNSMIRAYARILSVIVIVVAAAITTITPVCAAQSPVPLIDLPLVPGAAAPGGPGFILTVNGTGFASGSVVNWNGTPRPTTFVSGSELKAGIAPTDVALVGTSSVTVVNPAPSGSSNVAFFYIVNSPHGSVSFAEPLSVSEGTLSQPLSLAVGSFTDTGQLDIVTGDFASNAVSILLGDGAGTFTLSSSPAAGNGPQFVVPGDFNRDGKLDLVVVDYFDSGVSTLLGDGTGRFSLASSSSSGPYPVSAATGDFNRDGKLDLAVFEVGYGISILLGDGTGKFTLKSVITQISWAQYLAVSDFNRDGKLDLAVANTGNYLNNTIDILLGDGAGNFNLAFSATAGDFPVSIAVGDFNRDAKLDLAVANFNATPTGDSISILLGDGAGHFVLKTNYPTGHNPNAIVEGDFEGDGNLDLAFVSNGGLSVLVGDGSGNFTPMSPISSGPFNGCDPGGNCLAVGDFNEDGSPDLVLLNPNGGNVLILLNNSLPPEPTVCALNSTLNPSMFGQQATFLAEVSSTAGVPRGTVQLLNGSMLLGSGVLVNSSVSIPVSSLSAGSHAITGYYLGGPGFGSSKSAPITQTVTKATTVTTLVSAGNPVTTGEVFPLSATVFGRYGGNVTGTVTFAAGSATLGTVPLSSNYASVNASFATAGTYPITARYNGDPNNTVSTSSLSQRVLAATTTTITSSQNPSMLGQSVTFTATVTSSQGVPPDGETITFYKGTTLLGATRLAAASASFTTPSLSSGVFSISAHYPGDSTFGGSTSAGLRQTVNATSKSATATTLLSTLNPSIYGQKVTFTARVTTSGAVPPTGTVVFMWKYYTTTYTIGTAPLNSTGVATLIKSNLNADPYPMIAVYRGDANNLSSTSAVLNQTVLQTTSAAALTSAANPSTVGQAITFTAKITSPAAIPSGPVTFKAGTTVLGTAQLNSGKAIFTTSTLPAGSTVLRVTYNGNSNIKGSSASLTQTVQP